MCNPARPECHLNECNECPGVGPLNESLISKFEEEYVDQITFKQWLSVDRCTMETVIKGVDDFIEGFGEGLIKLKTHEFLAQQQKSFYSFLKDNLNEEECLITCDFAENYSFILQDEVQSYHWTSSQATIHPCIIYYKEGINLKHLNLVFISNCLTHNTVDVYTFQNKLIPFLKANIQNLKKIYYFSDGSAAQYKNRKHFLNLCHHKNDFNLDAEWHYFATSHGKSACDGLGGTVKRLAAKASLQRPYKNQIMTPKELYEFSMETIPGIYFEYSTSEEYNISERKLLNRFQDAKAIVGTQKIHCVVPKTLSEVTTKLYSFCNRETTHIVSESASLSCYTAPNVSSGYITVEYNDDWWLACILAKQDNASKLKVSFLHPRGPSPSFFFPVHPDIHEISAKTVLTQVEPVTPTGRVYTLSKSDTLRSSNLFSQLQEQKCSR